RRHQTGLNLRSKMRRLCYPDRATTKLEGEEMRDFLRIMKITAAALAAMLLLAGASTESWAETGRVNLRLVRAGFIVGAGGGSGTLLFKGRQYTLDVGGVSVGTIGVSAVNISGNAYHLRTAADIAGPYTAVGAGVAVIGGVKVATLQNANGVVLRLRGVQAGLGLSLHPSCLAPAPR